MGKESEERESVRQFWAPLAGPSDKSAQYQLSRGQEQVSGEMARRTLGDWVQQTMVALELVAEESPEFKKGVMVKAMKAAQACQLSYMEVAFMSMEDVEHCLGEAGKIMAPALLRRAREEEREGRAVGFECSCTRTFAFEQHRDSHQKMHQRKEDETECRIVRSVFADQPEKKSVEKREGTGQRNRTHARSQDPKINPGATDAKSKVKDLKSKGHEEGPKMVEQKTEDALKKKTNPGVNEIKPTNDKILVTQPKKKEVQTGSSGEPARVEFQSNQVLSRPASGDEEEREILFSMARREGGPLIEGLDVSSKGYVKNIWPGANNEAFFHRMGVKPGQKVKAFVVSRKSLVQGRTWTSGAISAEIRESLQHPARSQHRVEFREGGGVEFGGFASKLEGVRGRVQVVVSQQTDNGGVDSGESTIEPTIESTIDQTTKGRAPQPTAECVECQFVFTCQKRSLKEIMKRHMRRRHGRVGGGGEGEEPNQEVGKIDLEAPTKDLLLCQECRFSSSAKSKADRATVLRKHMKKYHPEKVSAKPNSARGAGVEPDEEFNSLVGTILREEELLRNNRWMVNPREGMKVTTKRSATPEDSLEPNDHKKRKGEALAADEKVKRRELVAPPNPEAEIVVTFQVRSPALEAKVDALMKPANRGWGCGVCGKENENKFRMGRHVEVHLDGISHPCPYEPCGTKCSTRNAMHHHVQRVHRKVAG